MPDKQRACKWHSPTPDEFCWACKNEGTNPVCDECGQHLNACHERDELARKLAFEQAENTRWETVCDEMEQQVNALESERNELNRKLAAAEAALAASCDENRSVALAEPGRTATCPLERELRAKLATVEAALENSRVCARHFYEECLTQGEQESDKEWLRRNPWLADTQEETT